MVPQLLPRLKEKSSTLKILGVRASPRFKERICSSRVSPEIVTPSSPSSLAPASPPSANEMWVNSAFSRAVRRA